MDKSARAKLEQIGIDAVCVAIADGMSIGGWARANGFAYTTCVDWIAADSQRADKYARARDDRADKMAHEIIDIADEVTVTTKHDGDDVTLVMDATAVARNRLRVDARKWLASKMRPGTYGDRVTQELTGSVITVIERKIVRPEH